MEKQTRQTDRQVQCVMWSPMGTDTLKNRFTDVEFDKHRTSGAFNWLFVKPDGKTDKTDIQTPKHKALIH